MLVMAINDELLLDDEYRKEKLSSLRKESDYFTETRRDRLLTESEQRAYRSVTGEFARVLTLKIPK